MTASHIDEAAELLYAAQADLAATTISGLGTVSLSFT